MLGSSLYARAETFDLAEMADQSKSASSQLQPFIVRRIHS